MKDDFTNAALKPGSLLVFTSEQDFNFYEKVVLLLKNDERGSLGIVINSQNYDFNYEDFAKAEKLDVLKAQPKENRIFLDGGPVNDGTPRVTVVFEDKAGKLQSIEAGEPDVRKTANELEKSGTQAVKVAIDYTGWGAGELQKEVTAGAWRVLPPDNDIVFRTKMEEIFAKAATKAGIHPDVVRYISNPEELRKEKGGFRQALDYIEPLRPKPPTR